MKNLKVKDYVKNFLATMSVNELPDFHREIVIVDPESKQRIGVLFGRGDLNLYSYSLFKNEVILSLWTGDFLFISLIKICFIE